ncbi:SDR family NAD(P)-dependent oxidoreductase [Microbacterium flavescens]|uniref:SDR family NAD(P)-dependent oxidoreductase n=1 Tax=Microbacterium flavescens TaxID=69366 RepID=UPI001BDE964D|nr:SDR family NAD(P)-dependent oxidoreductase [Microbacterium flavescens]
MNTGSHPSSRVAVVTGAATGLGSATVRALLAAGWTVVATRLPGQPAQEGMERARFVEADLRTADAPARVAAAAEEAGGAALFVSSAGISLPGPVELRADDLATEFAVNTAAPARIVAALLPQLRRTRGRVVLIGAGQGRVALPFGAGYAASKAGLVAIADALRAEVRHDGITVSLIEPGAVRTGILDASRDRARVLMTDASDEARERYSVPLARSLDAAGRAFANAMPPERVAELVLTISRARTPRPRYLIGREAWVVAALALLPARWRAGLVAKLGAEPRSRGRSTAS